MWICTGFIRANIKIMDAQKNTAEKVDIVSEKARVDYHVTLEEGIDLRKIAQLFDEFSDYGMTAEFALHKN